MSIYIYKTVTRFLFILIAKSVIEFLPNGASKLPRVQSVTLHELKLNFRFRVLSSRELEIRLIVGRKYLNYATCV